MNLPTNTVLIGDVRRRLADIPTSSIDTIITSPPYFRLRNYGEDRQIGLENSVDGFVEQLRIVAEGLSRVLKPSGSLWLNLGDTYAKGVNDGALPKSLVMAPERVAIALQSDGWILRNKVIWAKPNPMPTSVRDRLSCTYEVVYFFTRSKQYFFDLDAARVPHLSAPTKASRPRSDGAQTRPAWSVPKDWRGPSAGSNSGLDRIKASGLPGHPLGKNPGDVWTISTAGFRGAHHAVFPEKLVERPLLLTCPEKVCVTCGVPWKRGPPTNDGESTRIGELQKACGCIDFATRPGVVLDPFFGAGTTGLVAEKHGRRWVGVELNAEFARLAQERLAKLQSIGVASKS
jgi:site-specific DNA-methyltransferase (adenine-specific)